jgi:hypothetical protein
VVVVVAAAAAAAAATFPADKIIQQSDMTMTGRSKLLF